MEKIVLQQLHDHAGHLGVRRTTENVKERFYWPGYESDIEKWVHECHQCQKHKPPQVLLNTTISSKYIRHYSSVNAANTHSINHWNVTGALVRPNGITLNLK